MNIQPIITPASPSLASLIFDASFDSNESLTTSFSSSVLPTLETTTVTEVALGYHRNQQYAITAMTTSTGAVAERYAYTAYGQPTILNASGTVLTSSAVGNRYTYTGREWDETLGLHHFRARWMSPLTGRFLGREPIGYTYGSLYSVNNSHNDMDPTGNCPGCCCCPASFQFQNLKPIVNHPHHGTDVGVGHSFELVANMNFYPTEDGSKKNCHFQFNEHYRAKSGRKPQWYKYPGDVPDYEQFPEGSTMHDWFKFHDSSNSDSFKCEGSESVTIPDSPWERESYLKRLDPGLVFNFFYLTLTTGCDYCESFEWYGCQVIGYINGRPVNHFGDSLYDCSKGVLERVIGNDPFEVPDFPAFN